MREWNHSLYEHLLYTLEIKKNSNIYEFDRILKTECNCQHFIRNCRIKNLDDIDRDEIDAYSWRAGLLNVKEKVMFICYIMNSCLVMFLRGGKCYAVLMKHHHRVKGEKRITLRIAQQPKTKNINVVPEQLFCRQCKAKFLLNTDSLCW